MYRILCLVFALCVVSAKQADVRRMKRSVHNPKFADCGKVDKIIEFKELHFSPDPIVVPGKLTLTFHAVNTRTMPNMDIKVNMARKMSLGSLEWEMSIPCVMEVGSCTYEDICRRMVESQQDLGDELPVIQKLREGLAAAGAPSRCPIRPSTLNVRDLELDLPEIPAALRPMSGLADGTYSVQYTVLEHGTDTELGCLSVQATVSTQVEEEEDDDDCWIFC